MVPSVNQDAAAQSPSGFLRRLHRTSVSTDNAVLRRGVPAETEREIASNVSLHGRNIPTLKHRWQRIREPLRESADLKLGCDLGHSLLLRHNGHEGRPGGPPVAILLHEHPEDAGIGRNGLATRVFGLENCVIGREREVPINCH